MKNSEREFEILVIEDHAADARLMREAWQNCSKVRSRIRVLEDSKDAIVYLRCAPPYEDAVRPDLVLLDYKMPVDGGIALTEIKGDPDYLQIPVLVVTGSTDAQDILDAYRRHANCVYGKPLYLDDWISLVSNIADHWFGQILRPPLSGPEPALNSK